VAMSRPALEPTGALAADNQGRTALHRAAVLERGEELRQLLSQRVDVDVQDLYGLTPLHYAVAKGWLVGVRLLLAQKASVSIHDAKRNTALHFAKSAEVARALLEAGAEVDALNLNDSTPLHLACKDDAIDVCDLLIRRQADVHRRDKGWRTPLHYARSPKGVAILVAAGASIDQRDRGGATPLLRTVEAGFVQAAGRLVMDRANVNLADDLGKTPLLAAIERGLRELVPVLLEANADCDHKDLVGRNAHDMAKAKGDLTIESSLSDYCARRKNATQPTT
jgi:uncharacterized protein